MAGYIYGLSTSYVPTLRACHTEGPEEKAKQHLEEGGWVAVAPVVADDEIAAYSLEIQHVDDSTVVRVFRYAPSGSILTSYDLTDQHGRDRSLFVETVNVYTYPDLEQEYTRAESATLLTLHFAPDGSGDSRDVDKRSGERVVETAKFSDVDVSGNWDPPFTWGDWDRLGRAREG